MSNNAHKFITLYKKTSTGAVQEWDIRVEANPDGSAAIITTQGQQNGRKQEYVREVEGKNVGRKNETTPYAQAYSEAESKWIDKQKRKHYGLNVEESAEKRAIAPMLAHKYNDYASKVDWHSAFTQPKLDGNRSHVIRSGKKVTIITRTGLLVNTLPHIEEALLGLMPDGATWDGELYSHGVSLTRLNGWLRKAQLDSERVCFNLYDVLMPVPYRDRLKEIRRYVSRSVGPIHPVSTYQVTNEDRLMDYQSKFIAAGFEGGMLRHGEKPYEAGKKSNSLLKVKTFEDAEFKISGVTEGTGSHKGMAIFLCVTDDGNSFKVTAPGTHEEKRLAWENPEKYVGRMLTVKYQCFTDTANPVPFQPVAAAYR